MVAADPAVPGLQFRPAAGVLTPGMPVVRLAGYVDVYAVGMKISTLGIFSGVTIYRLMDRWLENPSG